MHAYIVFGKNINSKQTHERTERNIAKNKICTRDKFSIEVKVIFLLSFLMLGEGQLTQDKREIVGD